MGLLGKTVSSTAEDLDVYTYKGLSTKIVFINGFYYIKGFSDKYISRKSAELKWNAMKEREAFEKLMKSIMLKKGTKSISERKKLYDKAKKEYEEWLAMK